MNKHKPLCKIVINILLFMFIALQFTDMQNIYALDKLPSGQEYNQIGASIENFVKDNKATTAGMAVSVFDKNGDIYNNYFGYADIEKNLLVDANTVFEWGSSTKLLVWVSVMQLYEQGKIDLDKDISTYLPKDFLTNISYNEPVTMTNLMNHDAGFQELYFDIFVQDKKDIKNLGEALKKYEPKQIYKPSTVTAYSNWSVALAGYIVECISGQTFYSYVHKNIFDKLGMKHSALAPDLNDNAWVQEKRTKLECYTGDGKLIPNCFNYIPMYPAGMCTSTLEDYTIFAKALLTDNTQLFMSDKTRDIMFTPTKYCGSTSIGYNYHGFWMLPFKEEVLGHGGNTAGCSSYLLIQPQAGIGAVVMTNQSNETIYNCDMMNLIFGEFDEALYFSEKRTIPEGIYRISRTMRKGPFKILSLGFSSGADDFNSFWVWDKKNKIVAYPYASMVKVEIGTVIFEIGICVLWATSLIFLFVSLIINTVKKIKKRNSLYIYDKSNPFDMWSVISTISQLLVIPLLLIVVQKAMTYATAHTYIWTFIAIGILTLLMILQFVYGITKLSKIVKDKKYKVYNLCVFLTLLVSIINICYWNLFMLWWI